MDFDLFLEVLMELGKKKERLTAQSPFSRAIRGRMGTKLGWEDDGNVLEEGTE